MSDDLWGLLVFLLIIAATIAIADGVGSGWLL